MTREDSTPMILVAADPSQAQRGAFRRGADTVYYNLGPATSIRTRAGRPLPPAALTAATRVAVWGRDFFVLTKPARGYADTVVVTTLPTPR